MGEHALSSASVARVPEGDLLDLNRFESLSFLIHAGADLGADKKFEYVAFERSSLRTLGASLGSFGLSIPLPMDASRRGSCQVKIGIFGTVPWEKNPVKLVDGVQAQGDFFISFLITIS
jgi:hypothetical protein